MKIWAVTYSDGFEFSGVIVEAYDDETAADLRCMELNRISMMPRWPWGLRKNRPDSYYP